MKTNNINDTNDINDTHNNIIIENNYSQKRYSKSANKCINNLIYKWNIYKNNYIDLYGIDNYLYCYENNTHMKS